MHSTKQRLLDAGLRCSLSTATTISASRPCSTRRRNSEGSFYHHFKDKEDFALQVIDQYIAKVHAGLDACLEDESQPPLARVRRFFEMTRKNYREQGYMGCLLGGLGQELSGVSECSGSRSPAACRDRGTRSAKCLEKPGYGRAPGRLRHAASMAGLLVDCWEGAALAAGCAGPSSLDAMLDFYFRSAVVG